MLLWNPGPTMRDPERRPPLCPPLGMTWPFIKPSLAKASWKLWATVGHSDSSQAAHCLCPCPGRRQHREVQTGSAEVGQLWSWPWQVGSQPAFHASAGKPGSCWSGEHCGPARLWSHLWLPSFFHGEASTQERLEAGEEGPAIPQVTLGELLKCPRADSAVDRGSWYTVPVHIPPSFPSYKGSVPSLCLIFYTCQQSSCSQSDHEAQLTLTHTKILLALSRPHPWHPILSPPQGSAPPFPGSGHFLGGTVHPGAQH